MFLYSLLAFLPVAIGLSYYGASPVLVFGTSALSVIPLTSLIGEATEHLSLKLGQTLGGLLNATMGNVPEIVISGFALSKGLPEVVKASLSGSILGNVLFGMGLAFLVGGARVTTMKYNTHFAAVNSKMLLLAAVGLIVPSLHKYSTKAQDDLSLGIAGVLLAAYVASLVFTLGTHRKLFTSEQAEGPKAGGRAAWGVGKASAVLAASALGLAVSSEVLTGSIEPTADAIGLNKVFAGVFLLATVGNISGLINAVQFARQNKLDLTLAVTLGAGTQTALLVAPVLVLASQFMAKPMDLLFTQFEVIGIALAVVLGQAMTADGETNWLEGFALIAVYLMLGVGFYFL